MVSDEQVPCVVTFESYEDAVAFYGDIQSKGYRSIIYPPGGEGRPVGVAKDAWVVEVYTSLGAI